MSVSGAHDLDQVRRRVMDVIGHELRTPLTTIRGLADLAVDASDEELRSTLLPALVRNAHRAERLLDDLLIAGDVSAGTPVEPPAPVDLGLVVDEVVLGRDAMIEGEADGPVLARVDQVVRALGRIVDNAATHARDTTAVGFDADDTTVSVVVRTPVGTSMPDLGLGFEPFALGDDAGTAVTGLGVALPVARALARLDGGDVTISLTDGVVEARLRLPRVP